MKRIVVFVVACSILVWVTVVRSEQTVAGKVRRIVSLAPSITETLFAIGAEAQLVGICTFCDFPAEVQRIERIGAYLTPNVETIIAKRPDVVIGVPVNNPEAIAALRRAGVRVVIVAVDTLAQVEAAIRTVAHEAGRDMQGEALLAEMKKKIDAVRVRLADAPLRRVLMVVGQQPLITVGSGIFLDELITQARGVNVAGQTNQQWPHLSVEVAVAQQPEVIIDTSMGSEEKSETQRLGIWRNFPLLPAVRDGRLYGHRSYTLLRPGPRLAEGFEEIARLIHPERFQ
jgi:iron complex transport system substrate-binding protein